MTDKEIRQSNKQIFTNNQILKNVFEEYVLISNWCIGIKNKVSFGAHFATMKHDFYQRFGIAENTPIKIYTKRIYESMDKITKIEDVSLHNKEIVVTKDGESFVIGEVLDNYTMSKVSSEILSNLMKVDINKLDIELSDEDMDELLSKHKVSVNVGCGFMYTNHRLIPNIKNASKIQTVVIEEGDNYFAGAYVSKDLLVKKCVVDGLLVLNVYKFIK